MHLRRIDERRRGETVGELVDVANAYEGELPSIRLLGDERTLKDVTDDFLVASTAATLVEDDALELRTVDCNARSSMLVTADRTVALVKVGRLVGGLTTDHAEFAETADDAVADDWEDSEPFTLRTPAIDRVRQTLDAKLGTDVKADFQAILASMETARGGGDGLDGVTVSLLAAAKNRELFYDISKWGEDVGVASKATFSRTKTKLEDLGLIDTEKVPIDIGRPRLRLKLADDRLEDAPPAELANAAQSVLS
ncbi:MULTISPECIES: transcriptional regulator TbsP [Halobacterium]|uniref:transcriptional regulator TbsP n=1 Tax=Halobacterium TaxID=2239 RepID=UPI0032C21E33